MKPEIKKQIILHLPYLAFVYLFGKVGQAFRLAQGADLSGKLLHIGQGFSAAFASAAPSRCMVQNNLNNLNNKT